MYLTWDTFLISAQGLSLQSEEKVKWENAVSHCFSVVGSDQPGLIEQAPPSPSTWISKQISAGMASNAARESK